MDRMVMMNGASPRRLKSDTKKKKKTHSQSNKKQKSVQAIIVLARRRFPNSRTTKRKLKDYSVKYSVLSESKRF